MSYDIKNVYAGSKGVILSEWRPVITSWKVNFLEESRLRFLVPITGVAEKPFGTSPSFRIEQNS